MAAIANPDTFKDNYDYALTMGNIYRQRHDNSRAMLAFAHANELGGGDEIAERSMQEAAGQEGHAGHQKNQRRHRFRHARPGG